MNFNKNVTVLKQMDIKIDKPKPKKPLNMLENIKKKYMLSNILNNCFSSILLFILNTVFAIQYGKEDYRYI